MEPFYITIHIEGNPEELYVVPQEEQQYKIFDKNTYIGMVWQEQKDGQASWCAEGAMAKTYASAIGESISANQN